MQKNSQDFNQFTMSLLFCVIRYLFAKDKPWIKGTAKSLNRKADIPPVLRYVLSRENYPHLLFFDIFCNSKSTPANPCVITHFIGRGACVYCRLLSVLLIQIIKFGGKLVVNPRCSSIAYWDFQRNKVDFFPLLLNRFHRRDRSRNTHERLYIPL